MKYATIIQDDITRAGRIEPEAGLFHPFEPGFTDLATALPALLAGEISYGAPLPQAGLVLTAPILRPSRNIMCVGKNYRAHAEEFSKSGFDSSSSGKDNIPAEPIIFTKPASSIAAPDADILLFSGADAAVDYEAELAVVIGKGGRAIPRAEAMAHVFGYTVVNDVTARDLQQRHKQWFLGKGIDGFCPMGPYLVSADSLKPEEMRVKCWVNGELRQNASVRDLIFDIPTLIETISAVIALQPGDVIATGTPEGVGIGFSPPKFLVDGDEVVCEVSGIGRLVNRLRRA